MRTTIESKYNFKAVSPRPASPAKGVENEPRSTRFDDALKAAEPGSSRKARSSEESRPSESKKTGAMQKKAATPTEKGGDAEDVAKGAESVQAADDQISETATLEDVAEESAEYPESDQETKGEADDESAPDMQSDAAENAISFASIAQSQSQPQPQIAPESPNAVVELPDALEDTLQVQLTPASPTSGNTLKTLAGDQVTGQPTDSQSPGLSATASPFTAPDGTSHVKAGKPVPAQDTVSAEDTVSGEQPPTSDATTATPMPLPEKSPQSPGEFPQNQSPQIQVAGNISNAKPVDVPQPSLQPNAAQDIQFADNNHPQIISGIRGELLPDGGKMTLKLDPPELGALQVQVHLRDGVMTATFQTSNDDATRMLSHSLSSLKSALESQGINVEKLQVQQAPRDHQSGMNQDPRDQSQQSLDNQSARQEQQRREMLQRMWRKLSGAEDPLDMVA